MYIPIRFITLLAITQTTILVPHLQVKSLQLIWRSGTRRWNLRAPDLQISCRLDCMTVHPIGIPSSGYPSIYPIILQVKHPKYKHLCISISWDMQQSTMIKSRQPTIWLTLLVPSVSIYADILTSSCFYMSVIHGGSYHHTWSANKHVPRNIKWQILNAVRPET